MTTKPILLDLPFPILTPRLRIQPRHPGEGPILNRAIVSSLEHLKAWMPFARTAPTLEESEEHCRRAHAELLLRENFTLSMYERDTGAFAGSTGFHRPNWAVPALEIGYWVTREAEGRGYVTEAVNALTRYGFEVFRAHRLEIRCDSDNARSLAVMKRLGYSIEGTLRAQSLSAQGALRDTIVAARVDAAGLPALDVSW